MVPRVAFIPAINGVSFAPRTDGHVPRYQVRHGEHLVMRVAVTVPRHLTITALWFGISTGTWGGGPNGPTGMNPVLAHYTLPLSAGSHTFGLSWRIPHRRPGHQPVPDLCLVQPPAGRERRGADRHTGAAPHTNRQLIWASRLGQP
jgi:hypothetical protein